MDMKSRIYSFDEPISLLCRWYTVVYLCCARPPQIFECSYALIACHTNINIDRLSKQIWECFLNSDFNFICHFNVSFRIDFKLLLLVYKALHTLSVLFPQTVKYPPSGCYNSKLPQNLKNKFKTYLFNLAFIFLSYLYQTLSNIIIVRTCLEGLLADIHFF